MPLFSAKRSRKQKKLSLSRRRLRIERLEDRVQLAAIGDLMRTTVAVDVRSQPGFASAEIPSSSTQYPFYSGSAATGSLGAVIEGPRTQDARTWWRVDFGPGRYAGWVTQDVLTSTTIPYVRGIDVSHWQNQVNWPSVESFGIEFAFMKATESTDFVDPRFQYNVTNSRNAGMLVGFYHFADFPLSGDIASDARAEAAHFVEFAGEYIRAPGLPPVLDLEVRPGVPQPSRATVSAWARAWLAEVQRLTGVRPMIYANSNWAKNYIEPDLAQYNLWHARWTRNLDQPPLATDPGIWSPNWTFWQYTSNSRVPGIAAGTPGVLSDVDGDVFEGTLADLQAWARTAVPDTIPPTVSGVSASPTIIARGQPLTIRWTATDQVGVDHIGVYLYQNGMPVDTRPFVSGGTLSGRLAANSANLPNNGAYAWTVPASLPVGDYQFKVVAWNSAGVISPKTPNVFSNMVTVSSLGTVTNLVAASTTANRIHLTWSDSVTGESGYRIERSLDGMNFTAIGAVSANATSFDDVRLQSSVQYTYRVRAFAAADGPASNTASATTSQLSTITGGGSDDTYYVTRTGTLLKVWENAQPVGQPTYSSELAAMNGMLTIDSGDGNDIVTVNTATETTLGLTRLIYNAGAGANSLILQNGDARIDSTAAGGTLNSTVQQGAGLTTERLNQSGLTLGGAARVTLLPGGATSIITNLTLGPGATLDITNNALVIDYTGDSPVSDIRASILSGRGGAGLGKPWNGAGITSSTAAQINATAPNSRSVGYAENAILPLGPYTTFRGQFVDDTAVLIAYTRTGDANLDGVVSNDDVTVVGANYAPGFAKPRWDLGDFDYNTFVDNDDVTLLGAFYNPPAAPLPPPADVGWAELSEAHAGVAVETAEPTRRGDVPAPRFSGSENGAERAGERSREHLSFFESLAVADDPFGLPRRKRIAMQLGRG